MSYKYLFCLSDGTICKGNKYDDKDIDMVAHGALNIVDLETLELVTDDGPGKIESIED